MTARNILVIKLSALGDFVQALGPFAAIRNHHQGDRITLLTTALYEPFARQSGFFDEIWIDERPAWWQFGGWLALKRRLDGGGFRRIYDLQTSNRSGQYYRILKSPKPEWSGIARGCSHPHANPERDFMHTIDRQREQLAATGIDAVPLPDTSWVAGSADKFELAGGCVLLVAGGSAHRPAKRWPQERYISLAHRLGALGHQPVLIGADDEAERNRAIADACPQAINLTGQTDFLDIVRLARAASGAIGNDNGPMHLVAASGCPALVLFSAASDPELCAPRGSTVTVMQRDDLGDLSVAEVEAAMRLR